MSPIGKRWDNCLMISLNGYPKNKDKFVRLIVFFEDILDVCQSLRIEPIIDGSLAVFAYSGNQDINVNDVDTSVHERDFPRIMRALEGKGINCELKEWHVLQIKKDDLKVELGSLEFWLKKLPAETETLKVGLHEVKMLTKKRLAEFYEEAMANRLKGTDSNDKIKYDRLKEKYDILIKS